ncbi:MAG: hypothetical protein K1000chlam2_00565 [Chlamydiae bacterium]|nr:hypothetical protein [Chlamydiota bacterium]
MGGGIYARKNYKVFFIKLCGNEGGLSVKKIKKHRVQFQNLILKLLDLHLAPLFKGPLIMTQIARKKKSLS